MVNLSMRSFVKLKRGLSLFLLFVPVMLVAQDVVNVFKVGSDICEPVTLKTSKGTYTVRGSITINGFNIIKKHVPMFSKTESRNIRYELEDNFLRFWFRFFYKYIRYIEAGALDKLQEVILRDYPTFSGHALEEYFKCKYRESGQYTDIGSYWNKKGEDEIDLIAVDELEKKAVVAEIKRNKNNIKMDKLIQKGLSVQTALKGYSVEYIGLSMEDM